MNITQFVQPMANVVAITSLQTNDVYKRLVKKYNDTYEMHYGIVRDVVHNGEDAAFTAVEFTSEYGSLHIELKTYGSGSDLAIFPATPDEVTSHFNELLVKADRAIVEAAKELTRKQELRDAVASAYDQATVLNSTFAKEIA